MQGYHEFSHIHDPRSGMFFDSCHWLITQSLDIGTDQGKVLVGTQVILFDLCHWYISYSPQNSNYILISAVARQVFFERLSTFSCPSMMSVIAKAWSWDIYIKQRPWGFSTATAIPILCCPDFIDVLLNEGFQST